MKKIRKEVDIMGTIQECSNVIGLHGVYEDDYQVYVVMELCNGGDLERVLEVSRCSSYTCEPYVWYCIHSNQSYEFMYVVVMYCCVPLQHRHCRKSM